MSGFLKAIQIHDRSMIVLSEHSIQSEWVLTEIRKARAVEKKGKAKKAVSHPAGVLKCDTSPRP